MSGLPILLELTGRPVVVVGGGAVALRRAGTFAAAGAEVLVIAPELTAGLAELGVRVAERRYQQGDLAGAWLVVAATDDPAVNAQVAGEAAGLRIFCVRADRAAAGSAQLPAVLSRGALTISVNAGQDPVRAVQLRELIALALDTGALESRPVRIGAGSVALVGGGPGDPELITVRGRRLLAEADVVVTDRLAPRALLRSLPAGVEVIDCGKSARRQTLNQDQINALLVDRARAGKRVVRLKGGDPFVFGRGAEELQACLAAGLDVQVVPGVSSAVAAAGAAGIPLTHRGVAADFAVVSGHRDPNRTEPGWNWPELAVGPATLVLLMAMDNLADITGELIRHGRPAGTPAAVIQRATLPDQRVLRAPLGELARLVSEAGMAAPAVVVIGEVAAMGATAS